MTHLETLFKKTDAKFNPFIQKDWFQYQCMNHGHVILSKNTPTEIRETTTGRKGFDISFDSGNHYHLFALSADQVLNIIDNHLE